MSMSLADRIRANAAQPAPAPDHTEVLTALAEALDGEIAYDADLGEDVVRVTVVGRSGRSIGSLAVQYRPGYEGDWRIDVAGYEGRKLTERHAGHRDELAARARALLA